MPTPSSILSELIKIFPIFKKKWEVDFTYHHNEWTKNPYHHLFAEFSKIFRETYKTTDKKKIQEFCNYIEPFIRGDNKHEEVDNAICTCFLENVHSDIIIEDLPKYLGPNSLKFYKSWHGV